MELWRTGWPFSGMPWGRLAFAVVDTPVADALAYVGMTGLSFLLALSGFLLAWGGCSSGDRRAAAARRRGRGRRLRPDGRAAARAVRARRAGPRPTSRSCRATCPGPRNDILSTTGRSPRTTSTPPSAWRPRWAGGGAPSGLRALAGELHRGRPVPRLRRTPTSARPPPRSASRSWSAPSSTPATSTSSTRGSCGIPRPARGSGTPSTTRSPYGEYIPLRSWLRAWGLEDYGQLGRISRDMLSGTRDQPLQVAGVEVADAICFDVAYDDVLLDQVEKGADLLTVQTSNASFIFTDQIDQQFAITRLRAIESGRYARGRFHQRHHRRDRPRRQRGRAGGPAHPGRAAGAGRTTPSVTPGDPAGAVAAVLLPLADRGWGWRCGWSRIVDSGAPRPHRRRPNLS